MNKQDHKNIYRVSPPSERRRGAAPRLSREAMAARASLRDPIVPLSRREWWRGAAIYQVYVRSFRDSNGDGIGDLRGIIEKLDYIQSLNVDGLWLSPIYPSPQVDFGYDITEFRGIDPIHGDMQDFCELLDATHSRDLKLLLDFVPAHTSEAHRWFRESRSSRDNARADWYVWSDPAPDGTAPNNWLSSFGGSAWSWDPRRSQYYYHPFLPSQPALNLQNEEVISAICAEMRFWLDHGVDGFRLDAVQCLTCDPDLRSNPPASSGGSSVRIGGGPNNPFGRQTHQFDRDVPEAFEIIRHMRECIDTYEPDRVLVGELADVDSSRLSEKYTADAMAFHAVYDFDLINSSREVDEFIELLNLRSSFLRTGWLMNVFSNHDSKRAVSNLTQFAIDEGMRAEAQKLLIFMQFCLKGGGILFQGDELGLTHPDMEYDELRDPWGLNLWPDFSGRDGARTLFPWSKDGKTAGFSDSGKGWIKVAAEHRDLAVDQQEKNAESCLTFCRQFLEWRRDQPLLKWGGERVHGPKLAPLIMWDRFGEDRTYTCIVNFSLGDRFVATCEIDGDNLVDAPRCPTGHIDEGLLLPPLGFAIIEREGEPAQQHGEIAW